MEWMTLPLRHYARFTGRSRRKEFWMFVLLTAIVLLVASLIDTLLGYGRANSYAMPGSVGASYHSNGPIGALAALALLIPTLAVSVRRLHDTDRSGWWLLLSFIPLVGGIVLLVFYCLDGTRGENHFGSDPKVATPGEVLR